MTAARQTTRIRRVTWPRRAALLAFVTAFDALLVQVLVHRVVQAKFVNNLAFLVISLTMLGFALSGVVLSWWRPKDQDARERFLFRCLCAFSFTLVVATVSYYHAPNPSKYTTSYLEFAALFLRVVPSAFVFAVPFAFCGLILGTLLSTPELDARRIYFADLVGSAMGAWLVIWAIGAVGVERALLVAAALPVVAAPVLTRFRGRTRLLELSLALLPVLAGVVWQDELFAMAYPPNTVLGQAQDPSSGFVVERVLWDPVARIELSRTPPPSPETVAWPYLIGHEASFHQRFRRIVTQNNNAYTYAVDYDGRPESLAGIEQTMYAAAYQVVTRPAPRVLVVGVGGGFDVLTALRFRASEIVGLEVNAATLELVTTLERDYFKAWAEDPRVRLVHAEGRHYLAQDTTSYDVLQLSGVDSASGSAASPHVFSESYLYTAEAFALYLDRLAPQGVLNLMRQEYRPPREMLRALTTAVSALRLKGVQHPADHVLMLTSYEGLFTALLVQKAAFTPEQERRLTAWAEREPYFDVSASPSRNARGQNLYQLFLALDDERREQAFLAAYPFDIRPATDDRPFFFRFSYWWHLFSRDPLLRGSVPVLEISIVLLLVTALAVAVLCVYLPLRHFAGSGRQVPQAARYTVYFAGLGLGFFAIEMALIQKLGLFLGHPNYALSVVLAAMLASSGLGSLLSERIVARLGNVLRASMLVSLLLLLLWAIVLPRLLAASPLGFATRVLAAVLAIAPVGLLLGVFFPTGLERLKGRSAAFAPWAWGLNGIFSVAAPILAIAMSVTWGIDALLLSGVPLYLAVGLVLPAAPATEPEPEPEPEGRAT